MRKKNPTSPFAITTDFFYNHWIPWSVRHMWKTVTVSVKYGYIKIDMYILTIHIHMDRSELILINLQETCCNNLLLYCMHLKATKTASWVYLWSLAFMLNSSGQSHTHMTIYMFALFCSFSLIFNCIAVLQPWWV